MQSGQVIAGKYRLNQPIGTGGMASVWSATNTFTERHVAIKFMHAQMAQTADASRRFLLEAKVSARVNHPNIIDVLDVGQADDGSYFIVMELLQGVSLETAIRRQSPPMLVYELVSLLLDVARALAAAHRAGVVHRDLKPTNIFLHMIRESVAVPKVLDFGVSKFLEEDKDQALTVAGTVLGSPLYMSPEQASGSTRVDGRTDVFSFGAILFEALCGFRAYDAPNFNALIVAIATRAPKSIHEHAPQMPEGLRQLVYDCLVTDRDKRVQSFDEVVDRLVGLLPDLETSGLRLPAHSSAPVDPEATSALPVQRDGTRPMSNPPGPVGVHLSSPPAYIGGATPQGMAGDRNAITLNKKPVLWFGLGGAGAALLVFAVAVVFIRGGTGNAPAASPASSGAGSASRTSGPTPTAKSSSSTGSGAIEITNDDLPVVDVNSLPHAPTRPAIPSGMGRLSIAAASGWCNVSIDGAGKGPTPIAQLELTAGPHQLTCTGPDGHSKSTMIIVSEGTTSKVRVSF
jgi:serine/threonine-protein kinase